MQQTDPRAERREDHSVPQEISRTQVLFPFQLSASKMSFFSTKENKAQEQSGVSSRAVEQGRPGHRLCWHRTLACQAVWGLFTFQGPCSSPETSGWFPWAFPLLPDPLEQTSGLSCLRDYSLSRSLDDPAASTFGWITGMISANPKFEFTGACCSVFCLCLFALRGAGRRTEMEAGLSVRGHTQLLLTTASTLRLCFPQGTGIQAGWGTLSLLAVLYSILCCMGYSSTLLYWTISNVAY